MGICSGRGSAPHLRHLPALKCLLPRVWVPPSGPRVVRFQESQAGGLCVSRPTSLRYHPRLSLRCTRHVSTPHVNNPASSGSEVSAAGVWQTEGTMDRGRGPQIPALPQPPSGSVAVTRLPFSTSLQGWAGPVFPRVESPDVQDQDGSG